MRVDSDEWWAVGLDLADRASAGNAAAVSELAGHVRPWVDRLASAQFPYNGDAEDVAQNVCIIVMKKSVDIRKPERLRSWLAAITLNEVRRFYRVQGQESARLHRANNGRIPDDIAPERTSVLGGMRVDLLDAVEDLTSDQAMAFGMRQFGVPYDEIAVQMDAPVGSVKRWVNEARTHVRTKMR